MAKTKGKKLKYSFGLNEKNCSEYYSEEELRELRKFYDFKNKKEFLSQGIPADLVLIKSEKGGEAFVERYPRHKNKGRYCIVFKVPLSFKDVERKSIISFAFNFFKDLLIKDSEFVKEDKIFNKITKKPYKGICVSEEYDKEPEKYIYRRSNTYAQRKEQVKRKREQEQKRKKIAKIFNGLKKNGDPAHKRYFEVNRWLRNNSHKELAKVTIQRIAKKYSTK